MKKLTLILALFIMGETVASAHEKCKCPARKKSYAKKTTTARRTAPTTAARSYRAAPAPVYTAPVEDKGPLYARPARDGNTFASHVSIGPVAGFGGAWVSNVTGNRGFKSSPAVGIGLVYSTNHHFGIGVQLLVSHEGYESEYMMPNGIREEVEINPVYLRLPVQFTYFFGDFGDRVRPKIYAGPSIAVKVDEVQDYSSDAIRFAENGLQSSDRFDRFDAGVTAGVGANFRIGKLTWLNTDIGYYHGLVDVLDNDANYSFNGNRNLRLNVGLMWGL